MDVHFKPSDGYLGKFPIQDIKWTSNGRPAMDIRVSGSATFDTAFLPDCIRFFSILSGYWIGNLMITPKVCLKQLEIFSV